VSCGPAPTSTPSSSGASAAGRNFGVVTEFEFDLHPLGPVVLAGLTLFEADRAPEVLRGWRDWADAAPDEVATGCVVLTGPPEPFVPPELQGRPVVGIPVLVADDPHRAEEAVAPLRALRPAVDLVAPMPYTAFQAMLDHAAPPGLRSYWRGEYLPELPDGAIDTFLAHGVGLAAAGGPFSQMVIFRIGQAVAAVPDEATAFSHRDARYLFHPISVWADPDDDERRIAATRAFAEAMKPYGTGAAYLNFTPEPDRVRDAYGEAKLTRLTALKDAYDPDNVFRLNQNVVPRGQRRRSTNAATAAASPSGAPGQSTIAVKRTSAGVPG
jgi:FAD/FMN-containing dehydrogenase